MSLGGRNFFPGTAILIGDEIMAKVGGFVLGNVITSVIAGLGTFLTVLNAEASVLTQRRLAADLKARVLDTQVSLIRSLGGGWENGGP